MAKTLTGKVIAESYKGLVTISDNNTEFSNIPVPIADGNGGDTPLELSLNAAQVNVAPVNPNDIVRKAELDLIQGVSEAPNDGLPYLRNGQSRTWEAGKTAATIDLDLNAKVDKTTQIQSSDAEMIEVTNPTLASDVTLNIKSNVPNGVVKLNQLGWVPLHLLPAGNLVYIGQWDASGGNLPPDAGALGEYYIISVAGVLNLEPSPLGTKTLTPVNVGDSIIYLGVSGGWSYKKDVSPPVLASAVVYDNSTSGLAAPDVQGAIDEDVAALSAHKSDFVNPHQVTQSQVGLDQVNNTADLNKPVSTATQTALNLKANESDIAKTTTSVSPLNFFSVLTQAQYDAITPDVTTIYFITA